MRNWKRLLQKTCSREVFQKVLGIDFITARSLEMVFLRANGKKLEEIDGMTQKLIEKFRRYFKE